ncbi:hypothetical protein FRC12_003481 [Ceratobasidium sp. 428]|nr:hypothetical protein FRC12_003481 [Ceratobasidium sp. 428]
MSKDTTGWSISDQSLGTCPGTRANGSIRTPTSPRHLSIRPSARPPRPCPFNLTTAAAENTGVGVGAEGNSVLIRHIPITQAVWRGQAPTSSSLTQEGVGALGANACCSSSPGLTKNTWISTVRWRQTRTDTCSTSQ